MPYRHAHWALLLLLAPMVGTAFWRDYFGNLGGASFAFHAHGLTAIAWLTLIAVQSWSAHSKRLALHRKTGLALFAAVPLFVAGSVLVYHSMAVKYLAGHPFYSRFGPMLGMHDLISTIALVAMVALALKHRRRVGVHAGYMLATVLLVLPPVIERLPLPFSTPAYLRLSELLPMLLALALAARNRRSAEPMLVVAALLALQTVQFFTFGASEGWARAFGAAASLNGVPLALVAVLLASLSLLALRTGWTAGRRPST
ncbi:hypothetical protein P1X14_15250 [Sphingomonas sp. AOB5]|uniref:hypothetical protein n=1 Tax=Sphingomonas sp. AOB5 TaxID=3034017 RepID=UPI0023F992BD|nr:hypothetical protein [Sphingomonas sp. AOB5]MDF7776612.1 hypothetical protein [Sphingomonas sp. AOB5]